MTRLKQVHEELQSEKIPYDSEVDESIFELNESLKATLVKKAPKYLKKACKPKKLCAKTATWAQFQLLKGG